MNKSIYEYKDYKSYLNDFIRRRPGKGYGFRTRIAEVTRCNTAYVSQVLNQKANFSLEQAEDLNDLLEHTREEAEYFLLLIQLGRAGTPRLKKRTEQLLCERAENSQVLKHRVDIKRSLSELDQVRYYSAWYYAAVHILLAIPEFKTRELISRRLRLSSDKVARVLDFLLSVGLATKTGERYSIGVNRIFLGNDSIMLPKHHTNWRMKAIESINRSDLQNESNIHLSTILSFARKDLVTVKEKLLHGIDEARKVVRESSPEEELYCLSLDFFGL